MADEDRVAGRLLDGVNALREQRYDDAVQALGDVVADPAFVAASDLVDVRARAASLLTQACLGAGQPSKAHESLLLATSLVDQTQSVQGRLNLTELRAQVDAALADSRRMRSADARLEAAAERDLDVLLQTAFDPFSRCSVLIEKAVAEAHVGRFDSARTIGMRAVTAADALGTPRERVMSRLALARAGDEAAVTEALAIADSVGDTTLITAVAKTAEIVGIPLPGHGLGLDS